MILSFDQFNLLESFMDFKTADLQKDFERLNKQLFFNKLQNIKLNFFKSKKVLGLFKYDIETTKTFGKKTTKIIPRSINISTFYKLTYQQYLDVLAHEMIHLLIAQENIKDNNDHGAMFIQEMNRINNNFKEFHIKPSENADYYAVNTPNILKEYGVLLFQHDDEYSAVFTNERLVEDRNEMDAFSDRMYRYTDSKMIFQKEKNVLLSIYKVSGIPAIQKFKIKRTLSGNLELFILDKTLAEQIKSGKLIFDRKLK